MVGVDARRNGQSLGKAAKAAVKMQITRDTRVLRWGSCARGSGFDGGEERDDGEGAAVFDFAGGAEELFGDFQGAVVQAAGEGSAAAGAASVEGSADAGERVHQDDDVLAEFDFALAALDDELGEVQVLFDGV